MGVHFEHHIGDLASDLVQVDAGFREGAPRLVGEVAREGNTIAKGIARAKYGSGHARKYAGTFTSERKPGFRGAGVDIYVAEYGPAARGQGLLATILERGSRNNPAHFNLEKSADLIGPKFADRVGDFAQGLFWPGGDE